MYHTACPCCGAELRFQSAASVWATCHYCHSTLIRDADSVRDIGKMATLLEDYSPLQITSTGSYLERTFHIVGRIQLRYEVGLWNEWFLLFDDGTTGWLSESVGQYVLTLPKGDAPLAQAFSQLKPAMRYQYQSRDFIVSDIRIAECLGGEGELPFRIDQGWQAKVADARYRDRFLTLDYSDTLSKPQLFLGHAVTLSSLRMERLRDERMIKETTGKLKGSIAALDCPSCAAPLDYRVGITTQLVCRHCHSEIDVGGDKAVVLNVSNEHHLTAPSLTLALGRTATIENSPWTVTGALVWREVYDETSQWTEYLLYNVNKGFRWLVESRRGWFLGELMDVWVESYSVEYAILNKKVYSRVKGDVDYEATIIYAAGAFPWRAKLNDKFLISEYCNANADRWLARELSVCEVVWSCSVKVSNRHISQWFGLENPLPPAYPAATPVRGVRYLSYLFSAILLLINIPLVLMSDFLLSGTLICVIACCVILVLPTLESK